MARGGINEFQDPQTRRLIDSLIQQAAKANNGSTLGGLASVLNQGMAGYRMGQDKRQRGAANKAVAEAMEKMYTPHVKAKPAGVIDTIDNASVAADPDEYPELAGRMADLAGTGEQEASEEAMLAKTDRRLAMGLSEGGEDLAAQIDPAQLEGRTQLDVPLTFRDAVPEQAGYDPHKRALSNLLDLGGDNPYAARMAANMGMQQAGADRDARIKAGILSEQRGHEAELLKGQRSYARDEFDRQQIVKQEAIAAANRENDRRFNRLKTPAQQAQLEAIARAKKPPALETEYNKARGKNLAKTEQAVQDAGQAAEQTNAYLSMAKTFVVDPNMHSDEMGLMVGKFAQSLGIPMPAGFEKRVTNAASFEAMMGNILAKKLAQQKGPQTDRDANRMANTLATLKNTPEAKTFLIDAAKAMNQRDIDKAAFYRDYITKNTNSIGANRAWNATIKDMPLFGSNKKTKMPVFFEGFMKNNMAANPNLSREQVVAEWKRRYGR